MAWLSLHIGNTFMNIMLNFFLFDQRNYISQLHDFLSMDKFA